MTLRSLFLIVVSVVIPSVLFALPHLLLLGVSFSLSLCSRVGHLVGSSVVVLVKRAAFRNVLRIAPILVVVQLLRRLLLLAVSALSLDAILGLCLGFAACSVELRVRVTLRRLAVLEKIEVGSTSERMLIGA